MSKDKLLEKIKKIEDSTDKKAAVIFEKIKKYKVELQDAIEELFTLLDDSQSKISDICHSVDFDNKCYIKNGYAPDDIETGIIYSDAFTELSDIDDALSYLDTDDLAEEDIYPALRWYDDDIDDYIPVSEVINDNWLYFSDKHSRDLYIALEASSDIKYSFIKEPTIIVYQRDNGQVSYEKVIYNSSTGKLKYADGSANFSTKSVKDAVFFKSIPVAKKYLYKHYDKKVRFSYGDVYDENDNHLVISENFINDPELEIKREEN